MLKQYFHTTLTGFINSYSQLFFADSKAFAWLLLISSFINPITGLSGAIAAIAALSFSYWIGLNRNLIANGTYSYNALMVGLVLGSQYNFTLGYILILLVSAIVTVLIAIWINTIFYKYNIPSLSLSFLFTLWLVTLSMRSFTQLELSEVGLFRLNEWYDLGGNFLLDWFSTIENSGMPEFIEVYLKSLSAVFFQYNIVAGLITLIGLLIWSRIAFVLSLIGFVIGYLFYYSLSGEFTQLYYSYIGFNFILTAIALGGFYLVPSRASFILAIITMPVIGIFISGFSNVLSVYQLPLYSLPFSATVILVIMMLHQRVWFHRLVLVPFQYFSPEKNVYHYLNNVKRFKNLQYFAIRLPFFGEWFVSQGYDGNITHKADWKDALDFVVVDETQHTFKLPGEEISDFYCYNLPVLAPADGYIAEISDGIDDNMIGDIDLQHNWGNTIVIKHTNGLYSKLSHLKKETLSVRVNDFVKAGQIIALCGSSGRSPEPHLHFQLQSTPYIGSATLAYPLAYFITRQEEKYTYHENEVPQQGAHLHYPIQTPVLYDAFKFISGQKIQFELSYTANLKTELLTWECMVNERNETYLYCSKTKSAAYFVNNGTIFYFTQFYGDKQSVLFDFYLAAHKILLGYYDQLELTDSIASPYFHSKIWLWMQDAIAPFYQFLKVQYKSSFQYIDNNYAPNQISIQASVEAYMGNTIIKAKRFNISIQNGMINEWATQLNETTIYKATCLNTQS